MQARSSFEFHSSLEPFSAFVRREWKAIAFFGGGFSLVALVMIFSIDPAFFYPRLQTDPLRYLLKALAFIQTGSAEARSAVNLQPFLYAPMPGIMRAPLLMAFQDFDDQWRAIQVTNVLFAVLVALLSAYILSWSQPRSRHWMTIAFAFVFAAIAPWWTANVLYPLADAPYAAFSLGAMIVSLRLVTSDKPLFSQIRLIVLFVLLFTAAFLMRFTAPVIFVFAAVLASGRVDRDRISRRTMVTIASISIILISGLVLANRDAIFGRYLHDPIWFISQTDHLKLAMNPFASAIPSQIIPGFNLVYSRPPVIAPFDLEFAKTPVDLAWTVVGFCISAIVIAGIWRSRSRFLPEIFYVAAPFLFIASIAPSTARYLASYQPFFWIFFYLGAVAILSPLRSLVLPYRRLSAVSAGFAVVALLAVVGLRLRKIVGTANPSHAVSVLNARAYIADVAGPFRSLRRFIETLPKERTLLIGHQDAAGRWKVISDRDYYDPDYELNRLLQSKDIYVLSECGTIDTCRDFETWTRSIEDRVLKNGRFKFVPVFKSQTSQAQITVFKVAHSY